MGESANDGDDVSGCEAKLQNGFRDVGARYDSIRKINPGAIKWSIDALLAVIILYMCFRKALLPIV